MGCLCGENAGELAGIIGKVRSDVMNIGFILMGISCLLFLLLALLFAILKGKAAILISGFNTIPKYQRELYDQDRMSRDQRNAFLIWAGNYGHWRYPFVFYFAVYGSDRIYCMADRVF